MKEKKPFLKTLGDICRGVFKALPIGNVLVELAQNKKAKNLVTEEIKDEAGNVIKRELPHSYVSIVVQLLCIAGIVYAFYTKQIDITKLLNLLLNFI